MSDDVTITPPDGGERFVRENRTITILADHEGLSAFVIEFDGTFQVDQHTHSDHVDSFYVLDGEVEFLVADGPVSAGPGTFVAAPPGAVHGFRSANGERARVLNVHAPDAGFAGRIRGA
jgi:quercetin dioxygenase-like cupin family protein